MKSLIGLDVEESQSKISLHVDAYIQETLDIYKAHPGTKLIRPKTAPMQPGNALTSGDVSEMPDKNRQAFYRSMVARRQFAVRG